MSIILEHMEFKRLRTLDGEDNAKTVDKQCQFFNDDKIIPVYTVMIAMFYG